MTPDALDVMDNIDRDLAEFEHEHGTDVWTYIADSAESAGEQFAEAGMGAVSMGWNGTDSANYLAASGAIYTTANDPTFAEAEALSKAWRAREQAKAAAATDVPANASDFAPSAYSTDDDIPF